MTDKSILPAQMQSSDETTLGYMLKLSWPMVVANISFTIMQFVDTRMVAELGTNELAAILPASIISFIPASFMLGVMTSVNTFVSQSLGRGSKKDCSNYCWQVIYMGLCYALVTLAIFWPAAEWIFKTMGQPPEVIPDEAVYLRIMLYCQFLVVFIWSYNQFFMGIHRPIVTMYAALAGQIVNVTANYILIFGKFGFPQMGMAGAGWGTFIGLIVGVIIRTTAFLNGDINKTFRTRSSLHIDIRKMLDIIKIGLPAGLGLMINIAFWSLILFGLVGQFGKAPLAATSAVWACMRVSFMPIIGIGTALTAAVGKSIGRDRKNLAVRQTGICLKIALVYMGFIGLCFFLFRDDIMKFWAPFDDKVVAAGVNILIFAAVFQIFDAVLIIYGDALRGAGDTLWLAVVESSTAVFILGLGGYCMVKFFPQLGAMGPWIAAVAKIFFGGMANMWRFKSGSWTKIDLFKRHEVEVPTQIEQVID